MPLILSPVSDTTTPIELEGLTPDPCASLSTSEIQNFTCFEGNRKRRLADLFHISGTASDLQLVLQGDLSRVHWIGAGMRSGSIRIEGDAGRHLGSSMSGAGHGSHRKYRQAGPGQKSQRTHSHSRKCRSVRRRSVATAQFAA
ncbi:MAG UNVERIFIED_CONTAM: hypothetical protein LVR18_49630 [Planctomycetaceae bacterium]